MSDADALRARGRVVLGQIEEPIVTRLVALAESVHACRKCQLHECRKQPVFGYGNPNAELCFVGEGPGATEDAQGEPFVGKSGHLLDKMIVAIGLLREDVYLCNIVKCKTPNGRKPEPAEIRACMPYLREQIERVEPKLIVSMGTTAAESLGLAAPGGSILRARGQWKLYRGYTPAMVTVHPAHALSDPRAKRALQTDLLAVKDMLCRGRAV